MTLFETPRLLVRHFEESDLFPLHAVLSDPAVMRYIEPPFSLSRTEAFLADAGLSSPPLVYAVEEKTTSRLLGHLIYHPYDEKSFELGWILSSSAWGKGYASELTAAAISDAKIKRIPSLVIECAPDQLATRHIAEKYDFSLISEGELALYRLTL